MYLSFNRPASQIVQRVIHRLFSVAISMMNTLMRSKVHFRRSWTNMICSFLSLFPSLHASLILFIGSKRPFLKKPWFIASYRDRSYYGPPNYQCRRCDAVFWYGERAKSESSCHDDNIVYNNCCRSGKVVIPPFQPRLDPLAVLTMPVLRSWQ